LGIGSDGCSICFLEIKGSTKQNTSRLRKPRSDSKNPALDGAGFFGYLESLFTNRILFLVPMVNSWNNYSR
jgi:hypothetical protein